MRGPSYVRDCVPFWTSSHRSGGTCVCSSSTWIRSLGSATNIYTKRNSKRGPTALATQDTHLGQ